MAPHNRLRRLPVLALAAGWVLRPWPAAACSRGALIYQGAPHGALCAVAAPSPSDVWALGHDGSNPLGQTLLLHGFGVGE